MVVATYISDLWELFGGLWDVSYEIYQFLFTPISQEWLGVYFKPIELILGAGIVSVLTYTIIKWITPLL